MYKSITSIQLGEPVPLAVHGNKAFLPQAAPASNKCYVFGTIVWLLQNYAPHDSLSVFLADAGLDAFYVAEIAFAGEA
jgi:hypothetical protein